MCKKFYHFSFGYFFLSHSRASILSALSIVHFTEPPDVHQMYQKSCLNDSAAEFSGYSGLSVKYV